jgi:thiosulfate reductase cytochrome b subunit
MNDRAALVKPLVIRISHWINVLAILVMLFSGWRIYNADSLFGFKFSKDEMKKDEMKK